MLCSGYPHRLLVTRCKEVRWPKELQGLRDVIQKAYCPISNYNLLVKIIIIYFLQRYTINFYSEEPMKM